MVDKHLEPYQELDKHFVGLLLVAEQGLDNHLVLVVVDKHLEPYQELDKHFVDPLSVAVLSVDSSLVLIWNFRAYQYFLPFEL